MNNLETCHYELLIIINLSFQTEFGGLSGQLQIASDTQKSLKQQVEYLQFERDILLEELERQEVISEQVR